MYVRRSSRVALFAPTGEVLLVRSRFRRSIPGLRWAWFLPGGAVEQGESIEQAAVREVAEETGICIRDRDLTHVAFAEGEGTVGDVVGLMRDDVFAAETSTTAIVTDGMEPHELMGLDRFRWWPLPDLRETKESVFPLRLAHTLIDVAAAQEWPEPVRLLW